MNGQPIFVIETQHQVIQLRPYISYRLDDSAWHTIKFQRNGQRVNLQLDKSFDELSRIQKNLNEQDLKNKHNIEVLEKHFENILNNELKKLRADDSDKFDVCLNILIIFN